MANWRKEPPDRLPYAIGFYARAYAKPSAYPPVRLEASYGGRQDRHALNRPSLPESEAGTARRPPIAAREPPRRACRRLGAPGPPAEGQGRRTLGHVGQDRRASHGGVDGPRQAEHGMKEVVVAHRLVPAVLQAAGIDAQFRLQLRRQPHEHGHVLLHVGCERVGQAVQVDVVFAERLAVIGNVDHGRRQAARSCAASSSISFAST